MILFSIVIGVIQGLQYFTQAFVARTSPRARHRPATTTTVQLGYPQGSTLFYPMLLYQHGFRYFHMGYASAMAVVLLAVSFALTLIVCQLATLGALRRGGAR